MEFLKHTDESLQQYIHHFVCLILKEKINIHKNFLESKIHLLFKKEPAMNLRNWRLVALLQMIYKLVSLILNDRLSTHLLHVGGSCWYLLQ